MIDYKVGVTNSYRVGDKMWRTLSKISTAMSLFVLLVTGAAMASAEWWNTFYRDTVYPLALNVYHEARGEDSTGRLMVAYVTVQRAEENRRMWGGGSIEGVVYKGCQFSWTCDGRSDEPNRNSRAWEQAENAAILVALGFFQPPPELEGARYYMNPDESSVRNRCWFATSLRQVGVVGHHYFYAEGDPQPVPARFGCDTPIV